VREHEAGRRTSALALCPPVLEVRVDGCLVETANREVAIRHPPAEISRKDHVRPTRPRRVPEVIELHDE
jgi:hypothetical protein